MKIFFSPLFSLFLFVPISTFSQTPKGEHNWLDPIEFSIENFKNPSLQFAPFTRWWWPGNDVTKEELVREVNLFADNHFGGVEIQPFALVFPTKGEGRADRIMSYDTPKYYDNLATVMQEAQKKGMLVDLTDGSGWPPGGSHISKEDGNLSLEWGIVDLPSDKETKFTLPRPIRSDDSSAKLVALLAAKINADSVATGSLAPIDAKSIINITNLIKGNEFSYKAPNKDYKAIAIWSVPTAEKPMIIAKKDAGYVFNHFDSLKVKKNYDYLFGERTGLQNYYGKPLRAIFDDSYEFKADRHFSDDFISVFKKRRGYDITNYLPANQWFGYNNMYARMEKPGVKPDFQFSENDWRLRYDYDLTLSDLLGKHFLQYTKDWTESRGMLHRTQTYGLNMDIMASAGLASIPEVETMLFAKGSENGLKLITSGAHLYNRPIISSETAVFYKRAYMTTPQKIKLTFDKLFSAGVNQVIYHGTPYHYFPDGYPKEGWYPFYSSPLGIDFSSNINENNPFWKYIAQINQYAQRSQYILRSGKPNADVLIYYPFLNYSEEVANPKEVMVAGYLKETEPPLDSENKNVAYNREIDTKWLEKAMHLIDELNKKGITWDWINDASVQELNVSKNKKLQIRGNEYQSIVLFDLPYIQLKSAENLKNISKSGANILMIGEAPKIQPSYFDFQKNDIKTHKTMLSVKKSKSTTHLNTVSELGNWASSLEIPFRYTVENENFRQQRRKLDENSYAQFIWNESNTWQTVSIKTNKTLNHSYWLDAANGTTQNGEQENGNYTYQLAPFSSIFFYTLAENKNIPTQDSPVFSPEKSTVISELKNWNIQAGEISIKDTDLFDWKNNKQLKYNGKPAHYTSEFTLSDLDKSKQYFLDLGKVYYSADIVINGKYVKSEVFEPFITDISSYLKEGKNTIDVTVITAAYNDFVGQAENGERVFKKLKGSETMSSGLVGPVKILKQ